MLKKRLPAMLLILVLVLGCFSACGSETASTQETTSDTEESAGEVSEEVSEETAEEAEEAETSAEPEETEESEEPEASEEAASESSEAEEADEAEATSEPEEAEEELTLTTVELPIFEETETFTFWTSLPFFMGTYVSDMSEDIYLLKELQNLCNMDLEITSVNSTNESEQFNLMVAADDYLDIISGLSNYAGGYDSAISNEVIIDLYDLVQEYAPNYWYYVNSTSDIRANLITDAGALPTVATIYKETGCENRGLLYRSDWLEELGLSVPETYEELHEYVQLCNETYGSQGIALSGSSMGSVAGAITQFSYGYDFAVGSYNVIDGQVVYSYLNDSFYDYLLTMSEWYADGTIAADFYNFSTDEGDQGVPNGKYCVTISSAANLKTMEGYADAGAEYEIGAMNAPKVSTDDSLHYSWTDDTSPLKRRDSWAISTACEAPEKVLQVVNYLFSEEGQLFFNYGTEGYTFEYDENGDPQFTDLVLNNPDYPEMYATYLYVSNVATEYLPSVMDATTGYYYFGEDEWEIFDTFQTCDADGSYNLPSAVSLSEEENTEYSAVSSDVETYISTKLLEFITVDGALTEESFAEFQDTVRSMGGETMEALYQSAYERYLEKIAE